MIEATQVEAQELSVAFIIGAPRSGTTWLQSMLGEHPDICTHAELQLFAGYVEPWMKTWRRQVELSEGAGAPIGLPALLDEGELLELVRRVVAEIYGRMRAAKPSARLLLDKHPDNARHVELIERVLPGSRFVHLVRDGRDVTASLLAAAGSWGRTWAPAALPAAAARWNRDVQAARSSAAKLGERYLEIRYEDLRQAPERVLAEVLSFLSLRPWNADEGNEVVARYSFDRTQRERRGPAGATLPRGFVRSGVVGSWRSEWNPADRYLFDRVAGELLVELQYDREGWWLEKPLQRLTGPASAAVRRAKASLRRRLQRGSARPA